MLFLSAFLHKIYKMDFYEPLQAEKVYRSNNQDLMFPKTENYAYFLKKMGVYLPDFMDIYA